MKSKLKWRPILLLGLILVLIGFAIGCGQSQSDAYQEGYKAGFADGHEAGLAQSEKSAVGEGSGFGPDSGATDVGGTSKAGLPAGAISWDKAKDHIGDRATVWGPVAGTKYGATSGGQPTWLNIGKDYPSPERFVVIIWGKNRGNFPHAPEVYYLGKTIYVTGLITEYNGIPQIEVKQPSEIKDP
jgi:hypothetical protein